MLVPAVRKLLAIAAVAIVGVHLGACRDCRTAGRAEGDASPTAPSLARDAAIDAAGGDSGAAGLAADAATLRESEPLEQLFAAHPEVTTLDDVPQFLPLDIVKSFVLKHGRERAGERGHLVERRISQSADPQAPRAILWEEGRGLVLSYNGGLSTQKNGQRLDIHTFDERSRTFALKAVDFPIAPGHAELKTSDCGHCHGPHMRPIFSMYPDWPGFYGSDNDELTNRTVAVQAAELGDYRQFRRDVASKHPRYAPLFRDATVQASLGRPIYETFPYRPDDSADIHAISRAFAFRPGLRLGILLNRLQARALVAHVVAHPRYPKLGRFFLSTLLGCRVDGKAWADLRRDVEEAVGESAQYAPESTTLHYRQVWKMFGLDVRDVDIRYSYEHEGYRSNDATANPMGVGYIGTYWNSYFDGSATIDELVAYGLYEDLARRSSELVGLVTPNGLTRKYQHLAERFRLDEAFFAKMDAKGLWIPIPYPKKLDDVHHREGFGQEYRKQHEAICRSL